MTQKTHVPGEPVAADAGPSVLRDCADAEAYVASVCFKHGPPRLFGVELEWLLTLRPHDPALPAATAPTTSPIPVPTPVPTLADLAAALGPHAPRSIDPTSPARPLPGGSTVTVEPGGQAELASPPLPDLPGLLAAVRADAEVLHSLLATRGSIAQPRAADPLRPPHRLLELPRYRAMEASFDRVGPHGRAAMSSTAAVQVCLDAGVAGPGHTGVARRWALLHAAGPALLGAFANSPALAGHRTGWASSRWALWLAADPARTAPPPSSATDPDRDPAPAWAHRVLHTPLLVVRGDDTWHTPSGVTFADWIGGALPGTPTTADLDYHVSTLFPPVRAHGHLEVRYVDAQPGHGWALPTAVLVALLSSGSVLDRALEVCEPVRDRWLTAARTGLADPALARAAGELFSLALDALPGLGAPQWLLTALAEHLDRLVRRGRCPADDVLDGDPVPPQDAAPVPPWLPPVPADLPGHLC